MLRAANVSGGWKAAGWPGCPRRRQSGRLTGGVHPGLCELTWRFCKQTPGSSSNQSSRALLSIPESRMWTTPNLALP